MYVFSIDIPFKVSQSRVKMMPKVTAVSYLHSSVNDSAVHITAVSMTPQCIPQRSQWIHCACHISVNGSAVPCAAESDFLKKNSVLNYLWRYSKKKLVAQGTQGKLFDKKNRGKKSRVRVPAKVFKVINNCNSTVSCFCNLGENFQN
jgi:hypothetical protein